MMKRIMTVFLTVVALLALSSVYALAAESVEPGTDHIVISEDGLVTLLSGHMAWEEVSSLEVQLEVTPLEEAKVTFTFSEALSDRLTHVSYSDNDDALKIYIAGTKPLMDAGQTELELGKLSIVDREENLTAAVVNMAVDSLQYVYGANVTKQTTPEVVNFLVNQITPEHLQALVDEAETYAESDYTPESYAALRDALEAAKALLEKEPDSVVDYNNAYDALSKAIDSLEAVESDPLEKLAAELHAAMEQAQTLLEGIDRTQYPKDSVAALETAIENAKKILTPKSDEQTEPDEQTMRDALAALKAAMAEMVPEESENPDLPAIPDDFPFEETISLLERAYANGGTYQAQNYTEESFGALKAAMAEAEAALAKVADGTATRDDAINAYNRLYSAISGLVDVSSLKKVLAEAETYDPAAYTAESYAALQAAMDRAYAALINGTKEEVAAAIDALNAAIAGLVPITDPAPVHSTKPDPESSTSPDPAPGTKPEPEPGTDPEPVPGTDAPQPSATVAPSVSPTPARAPHTGDETAILPWIVMLCLTGMALAVLMVYGDKRRQ